MDDIITELESTSTVDMFVWGCFRDFIDAMEEIVDVTHRNNWHNVRIARMYDLWTT